MQDGKCGVALGVIASSESQSRNVLQRYQTLPAARNI
jgi:hypothetical protein